MPQHPGLKAERALPPGIHNVDGPLYRALRLFRRDGLELKHRGAAENGVKHAEIGVFRGGGDEGDPPVLDKFQQGLLLFFVEILDLVQIEQHAAGGQHGVKLGDDLLDVGNAGGGGVELSQGAVGALGDNAGHGGLAGAGGAVEDHVGDLPALHNAAQHPVPAQNMALAHHIVQGFGSYLVCQRLVHGPPSVQNHSFIIISRRDVKVKPSGPTSFSCGEKSAGLPPAPGRKKRKRRR